MALPKHTTEEVVRLYMEKRDVKSVARALGITKDAVRWHLKKAGIRVPWRRLNIYAEPLVRSPEILKAIELARKGLRNAEIAREMGISVPTVNRYIRIAFNPNAKDKFERYEAERERRRLAKTVEQLSPSTRRALLKVFGDVLEGLPAYDKEADRKPASS